MYWCAKPRGGVIEEVRSVSARYILAAFLVLYSIDTFNKIADDLPGANGDAFATASLVLQSDSDAMDYLPSYSSGSDEGVAITVSSGSIIQTMDDDSFLGQISNEKFWRRKRKKKSAHPATITNKKPHADKFANTPRSGLLRTKQPTGSFFDIFSHQQPVILPPKPKDLAGNVGLRAGGYRTLCVRLSDGYYWPLSFATTRDRFLKDSRVCKRSCAEPVRLFVYRNPAGRPEDMVDLKGRAYSDLENAWRYREEYILGRKCSPHPWEEASLAKHRAYAYMAKRSKTRHGRNAGITGQRKLVRVGRLRTMSTIDLGYSRSVRYEYGGNVEKVVRGVVELSKPSAKPVRVKRRQRVSHYAGGTRIMRLGAKPSRVSGARKIKRPKRVRARKKSGRHPRWAAEALGLD